MSKAKYKGYEQLEAILNEALEQAAAGKGKERHANERSFEDQPMQLISKLTGDNHGLAFQAIKKVQESLRLPDDRAERELLGAINYIAGMIIYLREAANLNAVDCKAGQGIKANLGSTVAINAGPVPTLSITGTEALKITGDTVINDGPAAKDRGIPRKEENTIPLKHYNDLLDQYAALEKRMQELN